jgi:hypothetical protein
MSYRLPFAIIWACFLVLVPFALKDSTAVFASEQFKQYKGPELSLPTTEEITAQNTDTFLNNMDTVYTQAFHKTLRGRYLVAAIFYSDQSDLGFDDPWLFQEAEDQAMTLVRHALYRAVQDTISEIEVLDRLREYGRNLSSAELTVEDGHLDLQGPSLVRTGHLNESITHDTFRSRFMIDTGIDADLGLSLETNLGPVQSRLTYFISSNDLFGMSVKRRLTGWSSLDLAYRVRLDDQRALATFNFFLP